METSVKEVAEMSVVEELKGVVAVLVNESHNDQALLRELNARVDTLTKTLNRRDNELEGGAIEGIEERLTYIERSCSNAIGGLVEILQRK